MIFFINTTGPCEKQNVESYGERHKGNSNVAKSHHLDFRAGAAQSRARQDGSTAEINVRMVGRKKHDQESKRDSKGKGRRDLFPNSYPENYGQRIHENSLPPTQDARVKTHDL